MEKVEGKTTQATEGEVFGGGFSSISKRPGIEGEAVVGINLSKAEGEVVAGAVGTKRPKAEGEAMPGAESSSLAEILSKRPRMANLLRWLTSPGVRVFRELDTLTVYEGDVVATNKAGQELTKTEIEELIRRDAYEGDVVATNKAGQELTKTEIEELIRRDATGPLKRKTLSRMDKKAIKIHMSVPAPTPYPRMPDELIDKLERPECPGRIRAEQDELAAFAQKLIDRDAEIRRQYALQGYAEIELTDDDDEEPGEWRSWAELKELGLVDG